MWSSCFASARAHQPHISFFLREQLCTKQGQATLLETMRTGRMQARQSELVSFLTRLAPPHSMRFTTDATSGTTTTSRAALERSDFAVRRLPLIFALK